MSIFPGIMGRRKIYFVLGTGGWGMAAKKKCKRKVQGVLQSQATALPRHQKEEETDKTKQAQIEPTYEKHFD